jgi:hypothetical protein
MPAGYFKPNHYKIGGNVNQNPEPVKVAERFADLAKLNPLQCKPDTNYTYRQPYPELKLFH